MSRPSYSAEPDDRREYTASFDRVYSRIAYLYDLAIKAFPVWKNWLRRALPYIEGARVVEIAFGTGWLLSQYAGRRDVHGVDLNPKMLAVARRNLDRAGLRATLLQANVEALPYPDAFCDTVVTTMSFSGFPDGLKAMSEIRRVLRPGGRLVIIDVNYPHDGNRLGRALVELWKRSGDIIRDMPSLLREFGFDATDEEIGGWGSVHLYVAASTSHMPEEGLEPPTRGL